MPRARRRDNAWSAQTTISAAITSGAAAQVFLFVLHRYLRQNETVIHFRASIHERAKWLGTTGWPTEDYWRCNASIVAYWHLMENGRRYRWWIERWRLPAGEVNYKSTWYFRMKLNCFKISDASRAAMRAKKRFSRRWGHKCLASYQQIMGHLCLVVKQDIAGARYYI